MTKSFTIRDLPSEERPRERLEKFGASALSAQELLSLLLGRGVRGESVAVISQKLLSKFGSLSKLTEASLEDLKEIKGLGLAKASQIKACLEISRRINSDSSNTKTLKSNPIGSAKDIVKLINDEIKSYNKEHFFVLSLDSRNRLLGIDCVSIGNLNANIVHPRETFEVAIRRHAAQIIISHNHPSGDTNPSEEDIIITRKLVELGKMMGIEIVDHLIVSPFGYFSFKNKKLI